MIHHWRTFQCSAYTITPPAAEGRPGGDLVLLPPVPNLGAVTIPNLAAGLDGLIAAIRTAGRDGVGTFGGNVTFLLVDSEIGMHLRILSEDYAVFLAPHIADDLLRALELMR